ncbi:ribonuclease P protein component 1 [[Eubacterium] cellulosolvens]|jgi:ribonuclease P protein subunit POP4
MNIAPLNMTKNEFIGLDVRISKSHNKQLVGMRGRIIDETRNTLVLRRGSKIIRIPKNIVHFHMSLPSGNIIKVDGRSIVARPEDRIKMRVRRW